MYYPIYHVGKSFKYAPYVIMSVGFARLFYDNFSSSNINEGGFPDPKHDKQERQLADSGRYLSLADSVSNP